MFCQLQEVNILDLSAAADAITTFYTQLCTPSLLAQHFLTLFMFKDDLSIWGGLFLFCTELLTQ